MTQKTRFEMARERLEAAKAELDALERRGAELRELQAAAWDDPTAAGEVRQVSTRAALENWQRAAPFQRERLQGEIDKATNELIRLHQQRGALEAERDALEAMQGKAPTGARLLELLREALTLAGALDPMHDPRLLTLQALFATAQRAANMPERLTAIHRRLEKLGA